jgi:hypothetical protein
MLIAKLLQRKIWVLPLLALLACDGSPNAREDAERLKIQEQLDEVNAQRDILNERYRQCRLRMGDLEAEKANLEIKLEDLTRWSRKLAERVGPSLWYMDEDERPLPLRPMPQATPAKLIDALNDIFSRDGWPLIILDHIENDTAYVHISDETQLTQSMGTTGATAYIEAVTYTLTSLKSVNYVDFNFTEGDHAVPGRYSR